MHYRWALLAASLAFAVTLAGSAHGQVDADGDGWDSGQDCDDLDATVHPGAPELCDTKDNDCDGQVDEGCTDVEQCTNGVDDDTADDDTGGPTGGDDDTGGEPTDDDGGATGCECAHRVEGTGFGAKLWALPVLLGGTIVRRRRARTAE